METDKREPEFLCCSLQTIDLSIHKLVFSANQYEAIHYPVPRFLILNFHSSTCSNHMQTQNAHSFTTANNLNEENSFVFLLHSTSSFPTIIASMNKDRPSVPSLCNMGIHATKHKFGLCGKEHGKIGQAICSS